MDALDKRILSALQQDSRIANIALADKVGLSPSACLRRVQALEKNKTIKQYTALLDSVQLGMESNIIVIATLSGQGYERLLEFENAVRDIPNILSCYLIGGDFDYLMRLGVKDFNHYEQIHRTYLSQLPHLERLQSHFTMREVINRHPPIL